MNLVADIGNTQIKFGLFEQTELKEVQVGVDSLEAILDTFKIQHAIISKTGKNYEVEDLLEIKKVNIMALSTHTKLPIEILYKTPETLGADRIAGSVGAQALFPSQNILKIDFGTCITYDFINADNQYVGGAISPGMMMRFKSLHNYTAKLPLIDPMQFSTFELTGTDTASSIASGVVNGIKEEIEGIIKQYSQRFGELKVISTGGDSGLFATVVKTEIFARPNLVLEGLNAILNYNL